MTATVISLGCSNEKKENINQLFDGTTLTGWEGDSSIFRIEDNSIVGGHLKDSLFHNYYLCTEQKFKNFNLSLEVKLDSQYVTSNSGVLFRATRKKGSTDVAGYQADIGYIPKFVIPWFSEFDTTNVPDIYPFWGTLVDENRKDSLRYPNLEIAPVVILSLADHKLVEKTINQGSWNELRIIAIEDDIEIRLNKQSIVKFRENALENSAGSICLQVHSGGPFEISFRNIRLVEI